MHLESGALSVAAAPLIHQKRKELRGASSPRPFPLMMCTYLRYAKIPVAMRSGDTPVPIPNTMVKPGAADGTVLETVRESRRLPEPIRGLSSAGRAPALQAGGREFESLSLHEGTAGKT